MGRRNQGPRLRFLEKRGCYYIVWTEDGRSRERSTGTRDLRDATAQLAAFVGQRHRPAGPTSPDEYPIAQALAEYAAEHAPTTSAPERIGYAVEALVRFWGERMVSHVTRETCRAYGRARGVGDGTIRRELTVMRAAFNHAFKEGRLLRVPFVELPAMPEGRDRWLTRTEAAQLLKAARHAKGARLYFPLFILLGLYTGARKEAILSLRWPQVDLARGRIDFNPPGRKRTSKGRAIIPIHRRLARFLRLARERGGDLGYVVNRNGERLGDIKRAFASACDRAGIEDASPHTLRHTVGTWMAQKGVPMFEIAGYLGQTVQRTTELYAHHHPDHMRRATEALG